MNNYPSIEITRRGEVATLTLNREPVLNAIDGAMVELLSSRLAELAQDERIRALILTGKGRGFCAGGDLRFAQQANPASPGD